MDETAKSRGRTLTRQFVAAAAALALLVPAGRALSDDPLYMAPPVDVAAPAAPDASTVFNWTEVPQQQEVPVTRAVLDRSGYQLYDSAGETIVVPFTDNNLYVMKFAVSHTGDIYFINRGDYPVLYVPEDGYLENATVSGARWYPFSPQYHPDDPVFLGCAPSWDAFVNFGWYPGLSIYGGYYCHRPFFAGAALFPEIGFFIDFGGRHWDGWGSYHDWEFDHPAPYHLGYFHRDVYRWANEDRGGRDFRGGDGGWGRPDYHGGGGAGEHVFRGFGGGYHGGDDRGFGGRPFDGGGNFRGGADVHGGGDFHGGRDLGDRPMQTGRDGGQTPGADRFFRGGGQFGNEDRGPAAPPAAPHAFDSGPGSHGGRSFQGGGSRSFPGGGGHSSQGGGHSFQGGGGHDHSR